MKSKYTVLFVSTLFLTIAYSGWAQGDIYYTPTATLQVNGKYEDQLLVGTSEQLKVSLDYETTEIAIQFDINNLTLNIDTLNDLLKTKHAEAIFTGELSLDYISTENHPPLEFTVYGWLNVNNTKIKVNGKGELNHISESGNYTCMLGITMPLQLSDLNIEVPPGMYDEVEVIISQALLEKDKN